MRELTEFEKQNLRVLTEHSISVALLEPTVNGLKKSIMDATGPVRYYLSRAGIHEYSKQSQGQNSKVQISAKLATEKNFISSKASLYRPYTKKGDPRIWFKSLTQIADPNDIIALTAIDETLYVFNISKLSLSNFFESSATHPLKEVLSSISYYEDSIAMELLNKLRGIAKTGAILSEVDADTGVGRTLESALGIAINSSKEPDFKGIELKAFRGKKTNRKNLFAQVPNWNLSKLKSSAEILDAFGYYRDNTFRLYCTVSKGTRNSQGLQLKIDPIQDWLVENSDNNNYGDFAVWTFEELHKRLLEKHNETFWITADSIREDGKEYFLYKSVEHTMQPIVSQFTLLLDQGLITLDHLIKKNTTGSVKEKGPIFKIKPDSLNLLFPPSKKYNLLD